MGSNFHRKFDSEPASAGEESEKDLSSSARAERLKTASQKHCGGDEVENKKQN